MEGRSDFAGLVNFVKRQRKMGPEHGGGESRNGSGRRDDDAPFSGGS